MSAGVIERDLTPDEVQEFQLHFPEHPVPDCLIWHDYMLWYGVKNADALYNFWNRRPLVPEADTDAIDGAEYVRRSGWWCKHIEFEEWKTWPSSWFETYRVYGSSYINLKGEVVRRNPEVW